MSALKEPAREPRSRVELALRRSLDHLASLQAESGSWPADYSGPSFLLPMYVALAYACGRLPHDERRASMLRYLLAAQHGDGSFGLHGEDQRPSLFVSVLTYVAVRLLGMAADDARVVRLRRFIHAGGSPLGAAPWGKLTLCLLGLYEWPGVEPILPELWLLPAAMPLHPSRLWCHCRQVYLPMAWLYGRRARVPNDPLLLALRDELYTERYERIAWQRHRHTLSDLDAYRPATRLLRATNRTAHAIERVCPARVRARALAEILEHIRYEDRVTSFIDIGPVNKVLNAFVHYFDAPAGSDFEASFTACEAYLWDSERGTSMRGYNGSELWDTAFAVQAVSATPFAREYTEVLAKAHAFIRDNQILDDVPDAARHYRHRSRGGWPFSNRAHGWPITDSTAEALKSALLLRDRFEAEIPEELLTEAVSLILSWQNQDGGFGTYERQRGGAWLEALNPSHVFGDIMVDYSHVECTSACIQALVAARTRVAAARSGAVEEAVSRGQDFLRRRQRPDGSFEGAWAVCFTYGTWFGVSGLLAAGASPEDPAIRRACRFLLSHQRADGGWGEHGDSCRERRYVEATTALVSQTAWALSTLVRARDPDRAAQARAVEALLSRQLANGGFPREPLVGVFNRTCLIDYDNYRHYFPLWSLAEWWGSGPGVGSPPRAMAACSA
jgi:squalene/oxidosqualene cyclase-like protein